MIYKIADAPPGGKGLLGIYPEWHDTGEEEAWILSNTRSSHHSILFTRNYFSHFFERIAAQLQCYGDMVDIVCGWDMEKIRMSFTAYNPRVEVFPLSAMHFNTFEILHKVRQKAAARTFHKDNDLFFAVSERPDGLKNAALLVRLLSQTHIKIKAIGYGRLNDVDLKNIESNPKVDFAWLGKASVMAADERQAFLTDLARSRLLLVTSSLEGYSRLIGEAIFLGVPVLLFAGIRCENWVHLHCGNCRLFIESSFDTCLQEMLSIEWKFTPPEYPEGNQILHKLFTDYLARRGLPEPTQWYPLQYGALNDKVFHIEHP